MARRPMNESKLYINFKTFAWKPIDSQSKDDDLDSPSYPLSMLRAVLLLNGIYQLVPSSIDFREFAQQAIDNGKVSLPGTFSSLINQVLKFYVFDRDILMISQGLTKTSDQEYWFDMLKDPSTNQTVIFLKSSNIAGSSEVLQLAYLDPVPSNIHHIYYLLRSLRMPEINLQEIVDSIAMNKTLVASLTAFIQKLLFDPKDEMGALEVFLLLGQEKFKEWVLSEIVAHSQELIPPQADRFHYPPFNLSVIPSTESLNGPGLIETIYILGFLGLADDIRAGTADKTGKSSKRPLF